MVDFFYCKKVIQSLNERMVLEMKIIMDIKDIDEEYRTTLIDLLYLFNDMVS